MRGDGPGRPRGQYTQARRLLAVAMHPDERPEVLAAKLGVTDRSIRRDRAALRLAQVDGYTAPLDLVARIEKAVRELRADGHEIAARRIEHALGREVA